MTKVIIIPARFESTRFPGKPLAKIRDKAMIEWVTESALKSKLADKVIVATEDKRIQDFLKEKCPAVTVAMTSKEHKSGTDRICEVIKNNPDIKYIVNFQGDEPLMPPEYLDKVLSGLIKAENYIVTLVAPLTNKEELNNPNIVKAVMDKDGFALYFSRSNIPYDRSQELTTNSQQLFYRHLGIYGYSRDTLLKFNLLPESPLEKTEQLEQLRALENGIKIKLEIVEKAFPAVDTPEDIKIIESILLSKFAQSL